MKYLFSYQGNIYNNDKQSYELTPLTDSLIIKAVLFAGIPKPPTLRCTFLYLETSEEINAMNRYANLIFLEQLIQLATGLPADRSEIEINQEDNYDILFQKYKSDKFYDEGMSYSGLVNYPNTIHRVQAYCRFLQVVDIKARKKFANSLQTFTWAKEVERLPNPHLRYTLYMTLYLSSINQLADNPRPSCPSSLVCPDCDEDLKIRHSSSSHRSEIEKLIRRLLTGNNVDKAVSMVKRLYDKLRSNYLHDGLLGGDERSGGFFESKSQIRLTEELVNITL